MANAENETENEPETEEEEEEAPEFTASEAIEICTKICEKIKEYYRKTYEIEDDEECSDPIETVDPEDCTYCDTLCKNMTDRMRDYKMMLNDIPKIVRPKE